MIDTHCHIIPGIDDGAQTDAVAVEMARIAIDDGVTTIIATPHAREGDYPNDGPKIRRSLERLRNTLEAAGVPLKIELGAEVHLTVGLIERLRSGDLPTYGGAGRYVLLECPFRTRPRGLETVIFDLRVAGITPVIAHPERTRYFIEDPSSYEELIRQGALGQMTSSSLVGLFGSSIRKLSEDWVARGLVHVLGSDAHDPEYRVPRLAEARRIWAGLTGDESARCAVRDYPQALLDGRSIDPEPPSAPRRKKKSLLERLLRRR